MKNTGLCLNSAYFGFYAHAGFVHGMVRGGFVPSIVTGCSSGAMIGALYCAGIDIDEVVRLIQKIRKNDFWEGNALTQAAKIFARGVSRYSGLLTGRKIRALLEPYLGGLKFSDLKIPLGVAVSNVTTGRRELCTEGSVLDSVMCSMAFPFLMEIQKMKGNDYIDGGVVDHEPTKEMILDPSVRTIVVHMIETERETPPRSPIIRAFHASLSIIDHETRDLKDRLALARKTKIVRAMTRTPHLGPDRTHYGETALHAGQKSAASILRSLKIPRSRANGRGLA